MVAYAANSRGSTSFTDAALQSDKERTIEIPYPHKDVSYLVRSSLRRIHPLAVSWTNTEAPDYALLHRCAAVISLRLSSIRGVPEGLFKRWSVFTTVKNKRLSSRYPFIPMIAFPSHGSR